MRVMRFCRLQTSGTSDSSSLIIVGPSADATTGSLLRPLNIYYSLKEIKHLTTRYVHIPTSAKSLPRFLQFISHILRANVIVVSGVAPWVSALLVILGKILGRKVIVDFHGSGWVELSILRAPFFVKMLFLISEKVAFKFAYCVVAASKWLSNTLVSLFGKRERLFTIENAVPIIFEKYADLLREKFGVNALRKYVCKHIVHHDNCYNAKLLVAPLPSWFKSNVLALEELMKVRNLLGKDVLAVITGSVYPGSNNIIATGYLNYVNYIALLLSADAVLLPYPSRAICGGVRNKVLEAGYAGKPVISTKYGMLFLEKARPWIHYIPYEDIVKGRTRAVVRELHNQAASLRELVINNYSFNSFKMKILLLVKMILKEAL